MCNISNKIKFCSCLASTPDKLRHYWIVHRFNKNLDEFHIGQPQFPDELFVTDYDLNKEILLNRLNESDAFDFKIHFNAKDKLEISINHAQDDSQKATYCFKFSKGKWRHAEYDVFELMNHYDELKFGKLKQIHG